MTLTQTAKRVFEGKTLGLVLGMIALAFVGFAVSRSAGAYTARYRPWLRYLPGVLLLLASVGYGLKKTEHRNLAFALAVGAGLDVSLVGAERTGVLARIGIK